VEIVEHPVCQVFLVKVVFAIVLVSLFVYEALVLAPVVVLELVKHAFAHSVCDVLDSAAAAVYSSGKKTPDMLEIYAAKGEAAETIDIAAYQALVNKAVA
jgi:hypothetical protein